MTAPYRFTYSWWNAAQQAQYAQALPNQRFWSINRAFQPGMQRFPVSGYARADSSCYA